MTRGRAMTPDDVLCRYLEAKGSRGGDVERRRTALRKMLTGPVADYVDWLERELAFCFESHGDAYGRATSSEGADDE